MPGTSVIASAAPAGSVPIRSPRSCRRGPRGAGVSMPSTLTGYARAAMPVSLPLVWSDDCLLHEPGGEVWIGLSIPGAEVPARALGIREALTAAGAPTVDAQPHDDDHILEVHDPGLVEFLRTAWTRW